MHTNKFILTVHHELTKEELEEVMYRTVLYALSLKLKTVEIGPLVEEEKKDV